MVGAVPLALVYKGNFQCCSGALAVKWSLDHTSNTHTTSPLPPRMSSVLYREDLFLVLGLLSRSQLIAC